MPGMRAIPCMLAATVLVLRSDNANGDLVSLNIEGQVDSVIQNRFACDLEGSLDCMLSRHLSSFSGTNNILLQDTAISIPGPYPLSYMGINGVIQGIQCSHLSVGSVMLASSGTVSKGVSIQFGVSDISIDCTASWNYNTLYGLITDHGQLQAPGRNSNVQSTFAVPASSSGSPPKLISIQGCTSTINFAASGITYTSAGLSADILAFFSGIMQGQVATDIGAEICKYVEGVMAVKLQGIMDNFNVALHASSLPAALIPEPQRVAASVAMVPVSSDFIDWNNFDVLRLLREKVLSSLATYYPEVAGTSPASMPSAPAAGLFPPDKVMDYLKTLLNDVLQSAGGSAGSLTFDINTKIINNIGSSFGGTVTLQSLTVSGLDSLSYVNAMYSVPGCSNCLGFTVRFSRLDALASLTIQINAWPGSTLGLATPLVSPMQVALSILNFEVDVHVFVGMDYAVLSAMDIGSLLGSPLACLLGAIPVIAVTYVQVTMTDFVGPTLSGFVDTGATGFLNDAISIFLELYKPSFLGAFATNLITDPMIDSFNAQMMSFINKIASAGCPSVTESVNANTDACVDLRTTAPIINQFTNVISAYASEHGIDIAAMLTFLFTNELPDIGAGAWSHGWKGETLGSFIFMLPQGLTLRMLFNELIVWGLGNVRDLTLFNVTDADTFSNTLNLGAIDPVSFVFNSEITINDASQHDVLFDAFNVSGSMYGDKIEADLLLGVNQARLFNTTVGLVLNHPFCLAYSIDSWGLPSLDITVRQAMLGLNCSSCSSPLLRAIAQQLQRASLLAGETGFEDWLDSSLKDSGVNGKGALREVPHWIEEAAYPLLDRFLAASCPGSRRGDFALPISMASPSKTTGPTVANIASMNSETSGIKWPDGVSVILYLLLAVNGAMLALWAIVSTPISCLPCCLIRRQTTPTTTEVQDIKLPEATENTAKLIAELNKPMFLNPRVPMVLRIVMPIACAGVACLFYSAHTTVGAAVYMQLTFAGQVVIIEDYQEFTLANSIKQALDAGAYTLAALIGILSGVWPYVKVELMLLSWLAPRCVLTTSPRSRLLAVLHHLGRFSQVDLFVLLFLMVAFSLTVSSPASFGMLPEGVLGAGVFVVPKWGLVSFVVAAGIAMAAGQLSSHYSSVIAVELDSNQPYQAPRHRVPLPMGSLPGLPFRHVLGSKKGAWSASCGAVLSLVILAIGVNLPLFTITYGGIGGRMLGWSAGDTSATHQVTYTLLSMIAAVSNIPVSAGPEELQRVKFIQASSLWLTVIAATMHLMLCLPALICKLFPARIPTELNKKSGQAGKMSDSCSLVMDAMLRVASAVADWVSLDVLLLAFAVILFELKPLATNLAAEMTPLCIFMRSVIVGASGQADACFTVDTAVGPGTWCLLLFVILARLLRVASSSSEDREAVKERDTLPTAANIQSSLAVNDGVQPVRQEYPRMATVLPIQMAPETLAAIRQADFILDRALGYDEGGQASPALPLYVAAAQAYLKLLKTARSRMPADKQESLKLRLTMALERAEEIKAKLRENAESV